MKVTETRKNIPMDFSVFFSYPEVESKNNLDMQWHIFRTAII